MSTLSEQKTFFVHYCKIESIVHIYYKIILENLFAKLCLLKPWVRDYT